MIPFYRRAVALVSVIYVQCVRLSNACRKGEEMGHRVRATKTKDAIAAALVGLLSSKSLDEITMSELARQASISRSTLYQHYGNVAEAYESLLEGFRNEVDSLFTQLDCDEGKAGAKPFCNLVMDPSGFGALFKEGRFLESYLFNFDSVEEHYLYRALRDEGASELEARAVSYFQLCGCFCLARSGMISKTDWPQAKRAIDRFIRGGLEAWAPHREK